MKFNEMKRLLNVSGKRYHLIGTEDNGVVAGLDLEGRLFTIVNGEVVSRVNPDAISGQSTRHGFVNPGGDGLWPAPEGTCFGYEYSTGKWRVPPGITGARYIVVEKSDSSAVIEAEIDLINSKGLGLPFIFRREIKLDFQKNTVVENVKESIIYIGGRTLSRNECLLAPWTLCQFDSGPGTEVSFNDGGKDCVRDLYDPSDSKRSVKNGVYHALTDGTQKYQIAMDARVDWLEFRNPSLGLTVYRTAGKLPQGYDYIDIIDAAPDTEPSDKGVRFSAYSDPSNFMEIEAVGGCPAVIKPNTELSFNVKTVFTLA